MKIIYMLPLLMASVFADLSTDLQIDKVLSGYNIIWSTPASPVTLIRGEFDYSYMIFTETIVYNGLNTSYNDTLGNNNTKYYRLEYSGGSSKKDINKDDFYELVTNNAVNIEHDEESLQSEARYAQFGRGSILKWHSVYEGFKIDLDYSGTIKTYINSSDVDNDRNANYYIIDNINNLTSVTVYNLFNDFSTTKLFKLNFNFSSNEYTNDNIIQIVAGSTNNVSINNGTVNNFNDKVKNDNRSIFAGSGGGSGGGCFLRNHLTN